MERCGPRRTFFLLVEKIRRVDSHVELFTLLLQQGVQAIRDDIGENSVGGMATGLDTFFLLFAVSGVRSLRLLSVVLCDPCADARKSWVSDG